MTDSMMYILPVVALGFASMSLIIVVAFYTRLQSAFDHLPLGLTLAMLSVVYMALTFDLCVLAFTRDAMSDLANSAWVGAFMVTSWLLISVIVNIGRRKIASNTHIQDNYHVSSDDENKISTGTLLRFPERDL